MFPVRNPLRLLALFCLALCLFSLPALAEVTEGYYSYHYDESIGGVVLTGYYGPEADVTVPDTLGGYPVRSLGFGSFNGLTSLTTVRLPNSILYMDGGAFISCNNIKAVHLPENLIELSNAGVIGNFTSYVGKDTATAKLLLNEAGSYPSARFIDPAEPDMQIYYVANPNTGEPELGLYKYLGDDEVVRIPDGTIHIYDQAFVLNYTDNPATKVIHMPDTVVSVGMQAFLNLPNLEAVYLSDNIAKWVVPNMAGVAGTFDERNKPRLYCSLSSTTIRTLTSSVTTLGITDPANPDFSWMIAESGGRILAGYYGIATHLAIPDGTTEIGDQAFYNNNTLVSVTLPDSVTTIGRFAFHGIKPLSSVVIPQSVTYIGDSAFESFEYWEDPDGYARLTLTLPDNVSFGNYPFDSRRVTLRYEHDSATAQNIMALNHEFGEVMYNFIDPDYPDFLLAHFENELYLRGYIGADSFMDIPPIVGVIEGHINLSTPNCDNITRINVPEGVTRLADRAFAGFPHIDYISLPSTLKTIGEYAFSSCSMKALVIPEGVTSLPAYMTENSIIRYVTIPSSVTSISSTSFTTSGGMRVYKIYCNKGSYAAKWAKNKNVPVSYLEDAEYTLIVPESGNFDIGESYDWQSALMFMPCEPDIPYTLNVESADPNIISVHNNKLSFDARGKTRLIISCPELELSTKTGYLNVYQPIQSFSVPEYAFIKYPSEDAVLSVSDVIPAKDTNPTYMWLRHDSGNLGQHGAGVQDYALSFISEPGVYSFDITSHSGITHHTTLIYTKNTDNFTLSLPSGEMTIGLTITPQIAVAIGPKTYKNISASYTLTSSNSSIVKVTADGRLKLLAPGTVTITATSFCGDTLTQKLTVSSKKVYTLPDSTLSIDTEAFASCPANKITIPDGCIEIGSRAFADCSELTEIVIPFSVTSIAGDAFSGSGSVTIFTPEGSYAASYAALHGIPCTSY